MFFRDFRHQVDPDETKQTLFLETAKERFYSNLSLLQLQLPELANQLRALQPSQYTLTRDRKGQGNCIHQQQLAMAWPPRAFEPRYAVRSAKHEAPVLIASELQNSGQQLVHLLSQHPTPFVLLYIPCLELFHASLHAVDWLPILQQSQLIVQLESTVAAAERFPQDLQTLVEHGVPSDPAGFAQVQEDTELLAAEQAWHFQQSMRHNHDCDPVLRVHTHKYKWQHEFKLQNLLIEKVRQQPMPSEHGFSTLILCGYNLSILSAAAEVKGVERVIFIASQPIPAQQLSLLANSRVQVHQCTGSPSVAIEQFVQLMHQLPAETPWQCRLYQAEESTEVQQLRQSVELELRYIVQPAMGVRRCLDAAFHVAATCQHLITRRTKLPDNPVLLLGNGPSLTATLEAIKSGEAKGYLLVSCGTTLATLYSHGITPHIHLELELYSKVITELDKDYLAHIHFCAPLGFQHTARALFASHSSFVLAGHAFDELVPNLPDDTVQVSDAFPTVLNLGIALFAQLGLESLWLAGFDLVFFSSTEHHAAGSVYDKADPQNYLRATGELLEVTTVRNQKALTKREFQFSALQAQLVSKRFPRMRMHQLSPGLPLGARYCKQLTPCSRVLRWRPEEWLLSSTQVQWHRPQHLYRCSELLMPLAIAEKSELLTILEQSIPKLSLAKLAQQPALYWSLGLHRSIAALLLRLQVNQLAELDDANSAFQLMLEDFKQAEAKI